MLKKDIHYYNGDLKSRDKDIYLEKKMFNLKIGKIY